MTKFFSDTHLPTAFAVSFCITIILTFSYLVSFLAREWGLEDLLSKSDKVVTEPLSQKVSL